MQPTLQSGDFLLLRKRAAAPLEIVVVRHPRFGTIVKRVDWDGLLSGDDPDSTDTDRLGAYDPATLVGVAVLAITPSGVRRPSPPSGRRSGSRDEA